MSTITNGPLPEGPNEGPASGGQRPAAASEGRSGGSPQADAGRRRRRRRLSSGACASTTPQGGDDRSARSSSGRTRLPHLRSRRDDALVRSRAPAAALTVVTAVPLGEGGRERDESAPRARGCVERGSGRRSRPVNPGASPPPRRRGLVAGSSSPSAPVDEAAHSTSKGGSSVGGDQRASGSKTRLVFESFSRPSRRSVHEPPTSGTTCRWPSRPGRDGLAGPKRLRSRTEASTLADQVHFSGSTTRSGRRPRLARPAAPPSQVSGWSSRLVTGRTRRDRSGPAARIALRRWDPGRPASCASWPRPHDRPGRGLAKPSRPSNGAWLPARGLPRHPGRPTDEVLGVPSPRRIEGRSTSSSLQAAEFCRSGPRGRGGRRRGARLRSASSRRKKSLRSRRRGLDYVRPCTGSTRQGRSPAERGGGTAVPPERKSGCPDSNGDLFDPKGALQRAHPRRATE